ncbi:Transcriptional regulator [Rhodovastum atsumiense]|uniref:Nitrogen regulatory protein P-II n=1 Tax=Rhodovastum atsumiense TaxID=504468 RepID=A0A5M6IZE7_9PROT|nr:transcriptional regulator [Rhodovastum atsumiense]KAA5613714.1 transcriptional regulator [Rhodovastum atsumiense]CAH2599637.1 Transcriptional regulator [Rhodovastum atsumiense]
MQTTSIKLLTVVTESVLAERLTRAIKAAGATGYTVTPAKGCGSRNQRSSSIGGDNVQIEVLATEDLAAHLLDMLVRDWFPHYALVAWLTTVEVVRGEKYAGSLPAHP